MALGFVYILENPSLPGLLKIGQSAKDPHQRAIELRSTGVPDPFHVVYFGLFENYEDLERTVHAHLMHQRHSQDREFFALSAEEAVYAIRNCSTSTPLYEELNLIDPQIIQECERNEFTREELRKKSEDDLGNVWTLFASPKGLRLGTKRGPIIDSFEGLICPEEGIGVFTRQFVRIGPNEELTTRDCISCDQGGSWYDACSKASLFGNYEGPEPELFLLMYNGNPLEYKGERIEPNSPFVIFLRGGDIARWEKFIDASKSNVNAEGYLEILVEAPPSKKKATTTFSQLNCTDA